MKSLNVRKGIIPGNSKSLWDAVKKAKDINSSNIPEVLFESDTKLNKKDHAMAFASFFQTKLTQL